MENKLDYELIDISNIKHKQFIEELWKDRRAREYYGIYDRSIEEFINSFNDEYTAQFEKLVKINTTYIGWIRTLPTDEGLEVDCIILKKFRGMGFGKTILKELISKNYNIILRIKRDNYSAMKSIESLPFYVENKSTEKSIESLPFYLESKSSDGKITYKLKKN